MLPPRRGLLFLPDSLTHAVPAIAHGDTDGDQVPASSEWASGNVALVLDLLVAALGRQVLRHCGSRVCPRSEEIKSGFVA